jgi:hypothetical protein
MATMDNEPDEFPLETERARRAQPSDWRRPLLMAGIGLALMLGGYFAIDYIPGQTLTPRQIEQERQVSELRDLSAKDQMNGEGDAALSDRLKQLTPPWRTPPYRIPGRLALYGGLLLFVAAGVLMYRHSPAPRNEQAEEE